MSISFLSWVSDSCMLPPPLVCRWYNLQEGNRPSLMISIFSFYNRYASWFWFFWVLFVSWTDAKSIYRPLHDLLSFLIHVPLSILLQTLIPTECLSCVFSIIVNQGFSFFWVTAIAILYFNFFLISKPKQLHHHQCSPTIVVTLPFKRTRFVFTLFIGDVFLFALTSLSKFCLL